MAQQLGVSQSAYSNWEIGSRELTYTNLLKIANVLHHSVIDVITYPDKYIIGDPKNDVVEAYLQIKLKGRTKNKVLDIIMKDGDLEVLK